MKQSSSRTSRNISFKGEKESRILHGERQSGANESQQECNAVWLILGSLSAWFYWEKWDDDRWISELTAGVEGRVIVAERRRVFSVSLAAANQSKLLSERSERAGSGVCVTPNRLRVNGRRRSHACFCVTALVRSSRWCCGWMTLTGGVVRVEEDRGRKQHQTCCTIRPSARARTTSTLLTAPGNTRG